MGGAKMSGSVFTVGLIAAWYSSNIRVLLLNRYLLSNYSFRYPIFLTMCHMTACALLSYVAIGWLKIVPNASNSITDPVYEDRGLECHLLYLDGEL
jgi:hypothetical protein